MGEPDLANQVRTALLAVADPARAPQMQAYMKSAMPYMGVGAVPMRQACKTLFADLRYADAESWQTDVLAIWRGAQFREEYYAAIELCAMRAARPYQRIAALALYEEMIVTGAWWDTTDAIASNQLHDILINDRAAMTEAMLAWSHHANIWLRRSAIICQLKAKAGIDLDLLYAAIAPSLGSKEFFLRKAIGWALRQHAKTDPDEVRRYVRENGGRLSNLSKREALKNIGADGVIKPDKAAKAAS